MGRLFGIFFINHEGIVIEAPFGVGLYILRFDLEGLFAIYLFQVGKINLLPYFIIIGIRKKIGIELSLLLGFKEPLKINPTHPLSPFP
jgi:hypothetical protein